MINKTIHLTIILILLSIQSLFAQIGTEELAYKHLKAGDYKAALPIFTDLKELYPDDATITYHWAVCMIENGKYQEEVLKTLTQGSETESDDLLNYYIAVAYHANNEFANALEYYEKFDQQTKNKVKKSLNFNSKREACENYENIFVEAEEVTLGEREMITTDQLLDQKTSERIQGNEIIEEKQAENTTGVAPVAAVSAPIAIKKQPEVQYSAALDQVKVVEVPQALSDTLIDANITSNVQFKHVSQFKSSEAQSEFAKAWLLDAEILKKNQQADNFRQKYRDTNDADKRSEIANQVFIIEESVLRKQKESKTLYLSAITTEAELWKSATNETINELNAANKAFIEQYAPQQIVEVVGELEIVDEQLIPITETESTEPTGPVLRYKVQIGAYSKGLPGYIETLFGKISTFRTIENYTDDKGIVVYTVGNLENLSDAKALQKQIRTEGVDGAFVVPYEDGKRVTMSRAREIEKLK